MGNNNDFKVVKVNNENYKYFHTKRSGLFLYKIIDNKDVLIAQNIFLQTEITPTSVQTYIEQNIMKTEQEIRE